MDPPESVPRFSVNQRVQHGISSLLGIILVISAIASILTRSPAWIAFHRYAGMAACGFFAFHLAYLLLNGIQHDVSAEHVAFLPVGWEWKRLKGGPGQDNLVGKYEPGEKGDYLAVLVLSALVATTGIFHSWPSSLGIPGRGALGWVRTIHAAFGAAWILHVFGNHVVARWLDSNRDFRMSIFSGKVPLGLAESRPAWIEELVKNKILIPVPQEAVAEDTVQTRQIRDLLEEGNRQAREGKYAEASATFEEALRLFPDYSQARFNLGISRMREGRFDLAEEQFRLFIAGDPFNPMAIRAKELMDSIRNDAGGKGSP
jgi:cytochrome b subunit of formate dehydrogenase